jgi:hypothetical protein
LNSVITKSNYFASNLAVVVLPRPGSPLNKTPLEFKEPAGKNPLWDIISFLFPFKITFYQSESHYLRVLICED